VVRYSVLHGHEHLFATKYRLLLPSEEELRAELVREQRLLEDAAPAAARGRGRQKDELHFDPTWTTSVPPSSRCATCSAAGNLPDGVHSHARRGVGPANPGF